MLEVIEDKFDVEDKSKPLLLHLLAGQREKDFRPRKVRSRVATGTGEPRDDANSEAAGDKKGERQKKDKGKKRMSSDLEQWKAPKKRA